MAEYLPPGQGHCLSCPGGRPRETTHFRSKVERVGRRHGSKEEWPTSNSGLLVPRVAGRLDYKVWSSIGMGFQVWTPSLHTSTACPQPMVATPLWTWAFCDTRKGAGHLVAIRGNLSRMLECFSGQSCGKQCPHHGVFGKRHGSSLQVGSMHACALGAGCCPHLLPGKSARPLLLPCQT